MKKLIVRFYMYFFILDLLWLNTDFENDTLNSIEHFIINKNNNATKWKNKKYFSKPIKNQSISKKIH